MSELKPDPRVVVSGPLSVTPLYAAGEEVVWWDGHSWNELAVGATGPINVTGDVLGAGTSTIPTTVLGLQGRQVSSTAPLDGQVLAWSASPAPGQWHPVPPAVVTGGGSPPGGSTGTVQINAGGGNFGGITIGGDATLNYSTGALSLATMTGLSPGGYQGITFDLKGRAIAAVNMNYAPLLSPNFAGIPQADTAAPGTSSRQLATTAYVDNLYSPGAYLDSNSTSVALSDGVSANLTSVSLTAGDWIVTGSVYFNTGTALNYNFMAGASTTSATLPGIPYYTQSSPAGAVAGGAWALNIPERRYSVTVPTTVYLVVRAGFGTGGAVTAQGHIAAEQMQKLITGTGGGPGGGISALTGDVTGSGSGSVVTTVTGLRNVPISTTPPTDTYVLAFSGGQWQPTAPPSGTGGVTGSGLTANRLVIGSGGSVIGVMGSPGATNTVLHGNAAGPPSFGLVDLTSEVTGNLPYTRLNSGTGASSTTFWRGDGTWQIPTAAAVPGGAPGNVQYNVAGTSIGGSTGLTLSNSAVTGLNVGADATGDIYFRSAGGFTRLGAGIGLNGYTLQVVGGVPQWVSIALGGGTVAGGAAGQIALYTGPNSVAGFTMSLDAVIDAAGAVTIQPLRITTAKIADGAVTLAKMESRVATTLLGRGQGAGNGAPQEITVGTGLTMTGTVLAGTGSGTVTSSAAGLIPWYPIAAASVQGHASLSITSGGAMTINGKPAQVPPALTAGAAFQVVGADGAGAAIQFDTFGGQSSVIMRRANGANGGVLSTLLLNEVVGSYGARGYDGTAYSPSSNRIEFVATETWAVGAHGGRMDVLATANGSPSGAIQASFGPTGVTIGTASPAATPAVGDLSCVRLFVGGAPITPGAAADTTATVSAVVGGQGSAPLTAQMNNVTTVASGGAVTLPVAVAGIHCLVRNSGLNALLVYPASGAQINNLGLGVAIGVPVNSTAYFEAASTTQWFTVP